MKYDFLLALRHGRGETDFSNRSSEGPNVGMKAMDDMRKRPMRLHAQVRKQNTKIERHQTPGRIRIDYLRSNGKIRSQQEIVSNVDNALSSQQPTSGDDALITTDAKGIIEYLNPTAEKLTGWAQCEAYGMQIARVFDLIDEQTGKPAPDHVRQCLSQGCVTATSNHALLHKRSGQKVAVQCSVAPTRGQNGELTGAVIIFKDITQERRLMQEMMHHATHDALTGLVNRREIEQRLLHALQGNREHGGQYILCYLDLDRFKNINDSAGHATGDLMLKQVAEVLLSKLRDRDTLARLGGDEFGLLLDNCPTDKGIEIAQTLITDIHDTQFTSQGRDFQIGVSIGLAEISAEAGTPAQLLCQADSACYKAKQLGRNQIFVFQAAD